MSAEVRVDQFKDTPGDNARRWTMEIQAAKKNLEPWHKEAEEAESAYLMKKHSADNAMAKRLAFFNANVQMQRAALYGGPPPVSCERRFADPDDDVARVAAEIQERLLNTDIERDSDTTADAYGNVVTDTLVTDFGCVRARYVVDWKEVAEVPATAMAPAVEAHRVKAREDVELDYMHWRDVLWGWSRVHADIPWIGFQVLMTREKMIKKFGEEVGRRIPLKSTFKSDNADDRKDHVWSRAEVWEIWDKESKRVFWVVEGFDTVLTPVGAPVDEGGGQPDPLGLEGFWPCPKFMILNSTTSGLIPKPDYILAKYIYTALDVLEHRCALLVDALGVKGVYDKSLGVDLQLILETPENTLKAVDSWAMLAENGGLRGVIDWFPTEQVANTLNGLSQRFLALQDLLFQLTGRSDLERGQASQAGATATEQRAKVKFGSIRMQRRQNELARLVSDAQRIKAEIIAKHFDNQTILDRCNCQFTADAKETDPKTGKPLPVAAVEMLKSQAWQFRITVKPENLALQDFGALKDESLEVLASIGSHLQILGGLAQLGPEAPMIGLEILKVSLARLKGGSAYEAILDRAVSMLEKKTQEAAANPQATPPDPKVISQQMKGQQDMQKIQAETQADMMRIQAEVQADAQREQNQAMWNVREHQQKQLISRAMKPQGPIKPGGV